MPTWSDTDTDTILKPIHAVTGRYPGFGGINVALHEKYIATYEATWSLNWTNRRGLGSDNIGSLSTRPGYADRPHFQIAGGTGISATQFDYPVRMMAKFFPDDTIAQGGQILWLTQTTSGANQSKFQKWDGANVTDIVTGLGNTYYPESITLGLPTPLFVWADLENGVYVYNGTTATKQAIAKSGGGGDITGALWLEQVGAKLVVSGNWVDAGESNIVYYGQYDPVTDTIKWTSSGGGGVLTIYAADSKSGASAPHRITGLCSLHGTLLVFTEDMRYMITGLGTAYQQQAEFPGEGCWSGKCIVKYKDSVYWWGKDGAYEWNGNTVNRISDEVFNYTYSLKIGSGYKWFGFVYEDQWWTAVQEAAGNYGCMVFDFKTRRWYFNNIPMVAAFHSLGGLLDVGRLYFASPTSDDSHYHIYCYGYDEYATVPGAVYADKVKGSAGSRTGTAISATWTTGRMNFGSPKLKDYEAVLVEVQSVDNGNGITGAYTSATVDFRLDNGTSWTSMAFPDGTFQGSPRQWLVCRGLLDTPNATWGERIQIRANVTGTKRTDLEELHMAYKEGKVLQNVG